MSNMISLRKLSSVQLAALSFLILSFALSALPGRVSAAPSTTNLLGHWTLDEGSGTTAHNSASTTLNGSLLSKPTWSTGQLAGALTFDGTDSVQIGNVPAINGVSKVSIAAWIKRTAAGDAIVIGKQSSSRRLGIETTSNGQIRFFVSDGSNAYGRITLNDTAWHHVVLTFDGTQTGNSNRLKAYVDGTPRTLTFTGTIPATTTTNTAVFYIGRSGSTYSKGSIDDVWLFARTLSAAEAADLATIPTPTAACSDGIDNDGDQLIDFPSDPGCVSVGDTSESDPDTTAPSVPTNLSSASVTTNSVSLSWSASTDNSAVIGYEVRRNGVAVASTTQTSLHDAGLTPSTTYAYTVRALDAAGNASTDSTPLSVTTEASVAGGVSSVSLSTNGSYLVDSSGKPFFMNGDSAWSLMVNLTLEDATLYLSDRKDKGYNVVLANLIEHTFGPNAPKNVYNEAPFTTPGNFTTSNEAYFARVDSVLAAAAQQGIVVLLDPLYLGYACGSEGWCAEIQDASLSDMRTWGQYVGERYKNVPNIIWLIGGDTDPSPVASKVREFVAGLREYDAAHLITAHNEREQSALDPWPNETWLTLNNVYTSPDGYVRALAEYNKPDTKPIFLLEDWYEHEHNMTPLMLRTEAYNVVLSGAFAGHLFGNCPMWSFSNMGFCATANWKNELNSAGSVTAAYVGKLFASRPFETLVPDQTHTTLTAGYQSGSTYEAAARASDGATLIAYVPTSRTVTVAMTRISGTNATAWWFNPRTAAATFIGNYPTTGSQSFTPPDSNDWVLVLDDASRGFTIPGTSTLPILDTTAPSVSLTAPQEGASVTGTVALTASATDDTGVIGVTFYLDGAVLGAEDVNAPYTASWNTSSGAPGTHALSAAARDAAGNTGRSATTTVQVTLPSAACADGIDNDGDALIDYPNDPGCASTSDTDESNPDITAPSVPSGLASYAVTQTTLSLSWGASSDAVGVSGYKVFRGAAQIATTSGTSFADAGLTASTTYAYTVKAYDAAGNVSAASSVLQVTTQAVSAQPSGLIGAWGLNASSGTVAANSASTSWNGTLVSTPTWSAGKYGNGLSLNGTDYVNFGNLSAINGQQKVTLMGWIKRSSPNEKILFGKQTTNHDLCIEAWSDGTISFQVSNGSWAYGTVNLNDTAWHHVALVFDGSQTGNANRLKAYVDGSQQTLSFSGTIPSTTTTNTTGFTFGKIQSDYSNGSLDEVRLYTRALTSSEIVADMGTPLP